MNFHYFCCIFALQTILLNSIQELQINGWQQIAGTFKQISIDHDGSMVGITLKNKVVMKSINPYDGWTNLNRQATQVSIRNGIIITCNSNNETFYKLPQSETWIQLQGLAIHTSIDFDSALMVIDPSQQLHFQTSVGGARYLMAGVALKADISNKNIVIVNKYNQLFYRTTLNGAFDWKIIDGQFKHASVNQLGWICAIDLDGNIFLRENPLAGEWKKIPGNLMQIDCKDYNIIGIDSENQLWITSLMI